MQRESYDECAVTSNDIRKIKAALTEIQQKSAQQANNGQVNRDERRFYNCNENTHLQRCCPYPRRRNGNYPSPLLGSNYSSINETGMVPLMHYRRTIKVLWNLQIKTRVATSTIVVLVVIKTRKQAVAETKGQASASECEKNERPTIPRIGTVNDQNGLYIPLEIFGVNTNAILDTGSSVSVANPKLFEEIPSAIRPDLLPWNRTLCMANGDTSFPRG